MPTNYPISAAYTDGQVLTAANVNSIAGGVNDLATTQFNAQTGTTYTLVLTDAAKLVTLTNAASITLTVPLNSSVAFPTGTQILLYQGGAGQVTVAGAVGVTLRAQASQTKMVGQYAVAGLVKVGTDEWVLFGNTST